LERWNEFFMAAAVIETGQLTKVYTQPQGWRRLARAQPTTAVSDVSLTVAQGELFGLLGPNGAGKTTLVKMLSTLILPSSGAATVAGHALADGRAIRAATGLVVSDERSFYWRISARRNLTFFAALHGLYGRAAAARVDAVLEAVDLQMVAERRFSNFSSGMRQRLAIARALLHQPRLLFLDEPTRSLDPVATQRLHALILRLMEEQDMTVFLITHDLAEAEKLCGRVALMHQGRIRTVGAPGELRRHLQPQRSYTLQVDRLETAVFAALKTTLPDFHYEAQTRPPTLHFWASEQDGTLTAVLDLLRAHNVQIQSIEGAPPTLEEVFAHYTQNP
jgi:ABC-2 type transport system ATP-binding protein